MCPAEIPYSSASGLVCQSWQGVVETWVRTADALRTHPEWKPGGFIAVQWQGWQGEPRLLNPRALLCENSEPSAAMLFLESDCTFAFAVLLSLAVGFEVFETHM